MKKFLSFMVALSIISTVFLSTSMPSYAAGIDIIGSIINKDNSNTVLMNLDAGEEIDLGDFTLSLDSEEFSENANSKWGLVSLLSSSTYTRTSTFTVTNKTTTKKWYTITQIVNYTYNGKTAYIDPSSSKLSVRKEVPEASYIVTQNSITNDFSGRPAIYKVGVRLKLDNTYKNFSDAIAVTKDGAVA